jgi:hypothetical protein
LLYLKNSERRSYLVKKKFITLAQASERDEIDRDGGGNGDNKGWDASHPQIGDKMGMGIGMENLPRDAFLYKLALATDH